MQNELELSVIHQDISNNLHEVNKRQLSASLNVDRITHKSNVKPIIPVIEIAGCPFASKGDFSVVGGLPKAGKTSTSVFMIASAFMKEVTGKDTLSIRTSFCNNKPIIYIDTEQPQAYTNKLRKQVLRILELQEDPENLFFINLRKYSSDQKREKVAQLMRELPDGHLWIIDGVADLIKDPNDTKEAFGIVEELMIKSDQLDCAIIGYIHENPGTAGKLRGNLGSEAERKCGGAITVKKIKDKGIHCLEAKMIRGAADFEPIFFRYDKDQGRMVSILGDEVTHLKRGFDKQEMKKDQRIILAKKCLVTGGLKFGDLVERIILYAHEIEGKPVKQRTAEKRVKELKEMGIINLINEFYVLSDAYIPHP